MLILTVIAEAIADFRVNKRLKQIFGQIYL